jgi:SagB-type dehydrogenase family enzyme
MEDSAIGLPAPATGENVSLEAAIARRRSRRAYRSDPLRLADVAQLLWAAQGVTGPEQQRTAPSAGALHPLALYLCATRVEGLEPGIYRYRSADHDLEPVCLGDKRRDLAAAAVWQDCIRFSACVLLFAADYSCTTAKYGERGIRYVHIEVGAAAENVLLEATALGLGTVIVGSFDDAQVAAIAHLPDKLAPIAMMPVGRC